MFIFRQRPEQIHQIHPCRHSHRVDAGVRALVLAVFGVEIHIQHIDAVCCKERFDVPCGFNTVVILNFHLPNCRRGDNPLDDGQRQQHKRTSAESERVAAHAGDKSQTPGAP